MNGIQEDGLMDAWKTEGWIDGWMDEGNTGGWIVGCMENRRVDGLIDGWIHVRFECHHYRRVK